MPETSRVGEAIDPNQHNTNTIISKCFILHSKEKNQKKKKTEISLKSMGYISGGAD